MKRLHLTALAMGLATTLFAADHPVQLIQNSAGLSEIIDIDNRGNIVGRKEIVRKAGDIVPQIFVVMDGRESKVNVPKEFTSIQAFRLSETKKLVGFSSRLAGHPDGNMQASVWDLNTFEIELLPHPKSFRSSCGYDIAGNGKTVCGYVVGRDPPRVCPCVWTKHEKEWKPMVLSTVTGFNPFLMGGKVVINDAGTMVAGCLVVQNGGIRKNQVFLWTKNRDAWDRKRLSTQAFQLSNINNRGDIAGSLRTRAKIRACIFSADHGLKIHEPLAGHVATVANDINNNGIAVGYSDDPPGPTGGAQGILIHNGQVRALDLGERGEFSSLTAINDKGVAAGFVTVSLTDNSKVESTASLIVQLDMQGDPAGGEKNR